MLLHDYGKLLYWDSFHRRSFALASLVGSITIFMRMEDKNKHTFSRLVNNVDCNGWLT